MATRMVPDDFEFERTLGIGAFSKVLVAKYLHDNRRYAVKIIAKRQIMNAATDEERMKMAETARREMRILLMCDHPHIIRFHASMQTPDDLMYVTELCEGGELLDAIKRRGTIPLPAARHAIAEVLSAVGYLHHGEKRTWPIVANAPLKRTTILHRDIKPENLILSDARHIKLIDFGTAVVVEGAHDLSCSNGDERGGGCSAAAVGSSSSTAAAATTGGTNANLPQVAARGRAQTFCGTTHYMSPELLHENYTCLASDYWAVGCVLFHMLTGKRPFDAPTQYLLIKCILEDDVKFPDNMDPSARDLCAKLLVKSPSKRLGSLEQGGMDAIKRHPFFQSINWDTLHTTDVTRLWRRDATWVKDSHVSQCAQCGRDFGIFRRKHHCRNCGNIFCHECSSRECLIPESTYTTQERVCDNCFGRLHHQ